MTLCRHDSNPMDPDFPPSRQPIIGEQDNAEEPLVRKPNASERIESCATYGFHYRVDTLTPPKKVAFSFLVFFGILLYFIFLFCFPNITVGCLSTKRVQRI
ncbi:hypothetical protein BDV34DRAFT_205318 [Aspergillus parasiticus]|uniref:Uncharacterized protein n=1 Tax=Aspergillus parasiticus TaxID=5067 RepID=A0A5N6D4V3_ASPPA|nr:hypothetical protein BDV34DRAFT_205318 [Aspergillus parasiticus]